MIEHEVLTTAPMSNRDRYQLLTSLVVPRPIGWISTYAADRSRNIAPFSYFAAFSATPMYVGVSVGIRGSGPNLLLRKAAGDRYRCAEPPRPRTSPPDNRPAALDRSHR